MEDQHFSAPDELLVKFLSNEASPQEREEVNRWLEKDLKNRTYFEEFTAIWKGVEEVASEDVQVVDMAWNSFKSRVDQGSAPRVLNLRRRSWLLAAAAILIGLSIGTWLLFRNQGGEKKATYALYEATDSVQTISFQDQSEVFLAKGAILKVQDGYGNEIREMVLNGKAFFNVTPDSSSPFIVQANGIEVRVLGTSFEVDTEEDGTSISVKSGRVRVSAGLDRTLVLQKGQKLSNISPSLWKTEIDSVEINQFSWQDRYFNFDQISLREATQILSKSFDVEFQVSNPDLYTCLVFATFKQKELSYILEVLGAVNNFSWKKEGKVYIIEGKGCK